MDYEWFYHDNRYCSDPTLWALLAEIDLWSNIDYLEHKTRWVKIKSNYCKTCFFRGHVIFAVFAVDRQSAKINDRDLKKIGKIEQ